MNREEGSTSTHLVIPDTQSKPGVPNDHLRWIGLYIRDKQPDVIVHLGDHWDMPSLSSYDKGKKAMENRRYAEDVEAGNRDFALLNQPLDQFNYGRKRRSQDLYLPRRVLLRGNHEDRIRRAVEDNAQLDGTLGFEDLESPGWEVRDFLEPVFIDGIGYSHYWANPMTGKPYGGMIQTRIKTIGHSFTMGHQQGLDQGLRFIQGPNGPQMQRGLVAGSAYLHQEDYKGLQGNAHWRGIIMKHQVDGYGGYDIMEVSLDYLCRKYEGTDLATFMKSNYNR